MNAKLVESKSGQQPHFVVKKASSKYNCDSDCPMWKCSKLCSHTIACAYQDGCLQEFLAQATGAPSFYALAKASTTTKAGKKPQKRKASSKSSTKAFSKLGEELSQSVPGSLQDHPIESNNCSQSATSVFQDFSTFLSPSSASSKAVQYPTVSTSQVAPSITDNLSCYKSTSTSLIQSPAISTAQTHTPGLSSTSLIQSPTISITQTHTPSVSVNRSKYLPYLSLPLP